MLDPSPLELDVSDFVEEFSHCFTGECRIGVLSTLHRVCEVLAESSDLATSLSIILRVMQQQMKMHRGIVTLYDPRSGIISLHDSFGLTVEERARGTYAPGEGVTGQVVQSGRAIVIPRRHDIPGAPATIGGPERSRHPRTAFFCVPILHARRVLGTIAAERTYLNPRLLKQDVELLTMVAFLIAPTVELYLTENAEKVRLENENRRLKSALKQRFRPANIIGNSKPMLRVFDLIERVATARATVLILGESGVGKELVANAIHYNGSLADRPFVTFNCAALPESIVESELFGHERGAFTGAIASRRGRFEQADGGTLFLDEVGELTLPVQAKLLRVLQERSFERVGSERTLKVDVRIIAATNRDLPQMVKSGAFREDLFYRLNVFPITVPPLRDRGSDIITLADHFFRSLAEVNGKCIKRISTPAINMLLSYHWPGNVRELENVMEWSALLSEDDVIHAHHLPPSLQTAQETGTALQGSLDDKLRALEYQTIVEALENSNGHIGEAARELGLSRRVLGIRMARHGITYKTFRTANVSQRPR